jgi:hypothetical protein
MTTQVFYTFFSKAKGQKTALAVVRNLRPERNQLVTLQSSMEQVMPFFGSRMPYQERRQPPNDSGDMGSTSPEAKLVKQRAERF